MRIAFRFRWIPFVATVLVVALGVSLARWQERRAAEKIALQVTLEERTRQAPLVLGAAMLPAAPIEFRRVSLTGTFVGNWPLYLDNRPYQGRAGLYLMMPFRIGSSDTYVLVARAWLPRNTRERDRILPYATPPDVVTIEGIVRSGAGHVMQLGAPAALKPGAIVQNLTPLDVAAASKLRMQDFIVDQTGPGGDGLVRDWPAPALGVERNQGYVFQWYALAVMAFLFFVITGFRRERN